MSGQVSGRVKKHGVRNREADKLAPVVKRPQNSPLWSGDFHIDDCPWKRGLQSSRRLSKKPGIDPLLHHNHSQSWAKGKEDHGHTESGGLSRQRSHMLTHPSRARGPVLTHHLTACILEEGLHLPLGETEDQK